MILFVAVVFQMSSLNKEYLEKHKEEVAVVGMGTRTRKLRTKRQANSTDDNSFLEKVNTKANEQKMENNKSSIKKSTKKQATTNQVANSESK